MAEPMMWAVLGLGGVIILVLGAMALTGRGRQLSSLEGRLAQMAQSQAAAQAQLSERLQAQERALAMAVEERLAELGRRVGESLHQSSEATHANLSDLKARLAVIESAQKSISELSGQVIGLQELLANKQARGAFGEIQLMDLVRSTLPPSAYAFQATLGGGRRVDCLVTLPNPPGPIAIDAKFPLESYRSLREARDEAGLIAARRDFAQAIRHHVRDIAQKYIVPGETADSALLFLPSEAVYAELHASFPSLVEEAFRAKVWIVSPTTLMATLTTVRAILKDVRMREQADLIQREVGLLVKDVERLDERAAKLQQHFELTQKDMRDLRVSTDKITRRGARIGDVQLDELTEKQVNLLENVN
ncbi:MAG TPA: DNA recombination protein RmuC [Alphaproteobacteria bacterium]|nr:DNA recombination protein RmuC [Alphaproteobacteria bacterium]